MDQELARVIEQLLVEDADTRAVAAEQLGQSPEALQSLADPGAAEALLTASEDPDERVREWISSALESLESPSPDLAPALLRPLADGGPAAYWAATLLGRMGPEAAGLPDAVSGLASLLARDDAELAARERAAWALGRIGASDGQAAAALRAAADSPHPRLKRLAAEALK